MLPGNRWFGVKQTDPMAVDLYSRHYSSKKGGSQKADWLVHGIAGPGEVMTLLTADGTALFVWQKQKYSLAGQVGVNCVVFRNEGEQLSSELILDAEKLCQKKWPGERMFTYIDPAEIASSNPGYCFQMAGWGFVYSTNGSKISTKRGLLIMEKIIANKNSHN